MNKQKLVWEVVHQVELDIRVSDYDPLYELLSKLDEEVLRGYLPEED